MIKLKNKWWMIKLKKMSLKKGKKRQATPSECFKPGLIS
jgi:hypothetical protein